MGRRTVGPRIFLPEGKHVYLCRFTVGGQRFRLSTGESDARSAEAKARELHAQATLGHIAPRQEERRVEEDDAPSFDILAAQYLVSVRKRGRAESYVRKQETHLSRFGERWTRVSRVTPAAIESYVTARADEAASRTIYKELVTLSRFLHWLKKHGVIKHVPEFERVEQVSDYKAPDLTPADVEKLLAELPDRREHRKRQPVREFFTVQWSQGMRPGEVMLLRWCDVDFRAGTVTVPPTHDKAREGRTVGLSKLSRSVLAEMLAELKAEGAFLPTARIFGRCDFRTTLEHAAERAGLPRVTPHHFRHARASELANNTKKLAAVQYLLGHKRLTTTDLYVRSRTEATVELLDEVENTATRGVKIRRNKKPRKRVLN